MTITARIIRKLKYIFYLKPAGFLHELKLYIHDFFVYTKNRKRLRVRFTDFYTNDRNKIKDDWFYKYMKKTVPDFILSNYKPHIEFFASYGGSKKRIKKSKTDMKVFFTGENTASPEYRTYDELHDKYNNDKTAYSQLFKFAICPENSYTEKYVTEKIFQALYAGCIPVYNGGLTEEYDNILNKNCYFFWNEKNGNEQIISEIAGLQNNETLFSAFKKEKPVYVDYAVDYVYDKLKRFDSLFSDTVKNKHIFFPEQQDKS